MPKNEDELRERLNSLAGGLRLFDGATASRPRKRFALVQVSATVTGVVGDGATVLDLTCDVSDQRQMSEAFRSIRTELKDPEVLLYNAGTGTFGTIADITPEQYEADWRVNAFGAFVAAREAAPAMIAQGRGTMLFTGATGGVKAGPKSVSFGPAKFAMRGLAQSLARDLGPRGVQVAWINVDGSIDIPGARGLKPSLKEGDFLKPEAVAETYWHLAHQDPSAGTMELEVRPFKEKF
jgi:NAD(P)-dependent dehydrogenase (short-subunit alcohol dehydrogenase family)